RLTNPRGDIDGLLVQSSSTLMMDDLMEAVREALRAHRHLRPAQQDNFVMETTASALQFFERITNTMTIIRAALPGLSLIVGCMGILNIMLLPGGEPAQRLARGRSLGGRRGDSRRQFVGEAATLRTVGAIVRIALGIAAANIISIKTPLPGAVAPWSLVAAT